MAHITRHRSVAEHTASACCRLVHWGRALALALAAGIGAEGAVAQTNPMAEFANNGGVPGTWRAVVVGVADYDDLPDLAFADNDAEAFTKYLLEGLELPPENVATFIGPAATVPAIYRQLFEYAAETGPTDRLLFYFAGHGDVQRIGGDEVGGAYLLLQGAPRGMYDIGQGTLDPAHLERGVLQRLKSNGGGEFYLLLDACRSGKAATTVTYAAEALRQLNRSTEATKLLSSRGDELSWESSEFGGGHGVFTYHLLRGLYGLADSDKDALLNFEEVVRYVTDEVRKATSRAPFRTQTPVPSYAADHYAPLFPIHPDLLARADVMAGAALPSLEAAGDRLEGSRIAALPVSGDTAIARRLAALQAALDDGHLLEPSGTGQENAWSLYQGLEAAAGADAEVVERARGSLAVALQEAAEHPLRRFLRGVSDFPSVREYRDAAAALARAAELLGPMYPLAEEIDSRRTLLEAQAIVAERDFSRFGEARSLLAEALDEGPESAPHHAVLAALHGAERDYATAHEHADRTLVLAPHWEYAHKVKADLLRRQRRFDEALAAYDRLLELFPNSHYAHNNRGVLYDNLGRNAAARSDFQRAFDLSGDAFYLANLASVARGQDRLQEADSLLTLAVALAPRSAAVHQQAGLLAEDLWEGDKALEHLERAADLDPFDARTRVYLGNLHFRENRRRAEDEFRMALALDPGYAWAHARLADVLAAGEGPAAGEAVLLDADSALALLPGPPYYLARFYEARGRIQEAEDRYRQAISRDSGYVDAYLRLALMIGDQGRHEEAESLFAAALDLARGNPIPSLRQGNYRYSRGDLVGAVDSYARALATDPLNIEVAAAMAEVLAAQGEFAEAVDTYHEVAQQDSIRYGRLAIAERLDAHAARFEADGDIDNAVLAASVAHEFAPGARAPGHRLARLSYSRGDAGEALPVVERLLSSLDASESSARAALLTLLSLIQIDLGSTGEALASITAANELRMIPDQKSLALVLWAAGERDSALALYVAARTQPPPVSYSPKALGFLAELAEAAGARPSEPPHGP